jgi:hypothetical protein
VYYVVLKNYIKSPKGVLCFMKKFFALFTIVAVLAVAGSAFAADPVVTATTSRVEVNLTGEAKTESVSLSATNPNGGTITWTASALGGITATLASETGLTNTLTITVPADATGNPTVEVSVNERWSDTAGHTGATGSTTISVVIYSPNPPAPTADSGGMSKEVPSNVLNELVGEELPDTVTFGTSPHSSTADISMGDGTTPVAALPPMKGLPDNGGPYVVAITFGTISDTLTAVPALYPNGSNSDPVAVSLYVDVNGTLTQVTNENVGILIRSHTTAYMKFKIINRVIVGAFMGEVLASTVDISDPILAASSGSSPSPAGPGKSGGGCDAGFTALALAVLGGFIATRRK